MMALGLFEGVTPERRDAAASEDDDFAGDTSAEDDGKPWTATSDAVETVTDEPEAIAEDGPSPVALYGRSCSTARRSRAEATPVDEQIAHTDEDEAPADESESVFDEVSEDETQDASVDEPVDAPAGDMADYAEERDCQPEIEPEEDATPDVVTEPLHVLAKHEQTDFLFPSDRALAGTVFG